RGCFARVDLVTMLARDHQYARVAARVAAIMDYERATLHGNPNRFRIEAKPGSVHRLTGAATSNGRSSNLFTTIPASVPAPPREEATGMELRLSNSRTNNGELVIRPETAHTSHPALWI